MSIRLRERMVRDQLRPRGICDARVLGAMCRIPRHLFVPEKDKNAAYEDHPLPIGRGQTISQPFIVAYMTQVLAPGPGTRVLEVGTGSGYQSAVLAELAGEVYSLELLPPLALSASRILKTLGYDNVQVRVGDGYRGWHAQAPFDRIIVTAAPPQVPQILTKQLKVGGRMVLPVGELSQELLLITKSETGIQRQKLMPVRFVPMLHKG